MLLRRFTIFYRNPRPSICLLSNHHPIIIVNTSTNHISSNSCPCSNSIGTSLLHREQQRHRQQFGTTPIESNSTSTSPRRAEEKGAEAAEGNEAKKDAKVKMVTILARDFIKLDESGDQEQKMFIKLAQDDDSKFFRIGKFPQIFVPEDAYMVVQAMDALLGDLRDKQADQKSTDGTPIASRLISGGKFHDYQLEAIHFGGELCFRMGTVQNEASGSAHKPRDLLAPIRVLPWLRQRMAEMLAEHDGSQQLGPMPPVTEWISQKVNIQPHEILASDLMEIGLFSSRQQKMSIKLVQDKSGCKLFHIRKFPQIFVPEDAYMVVGAMDALLADLEDKADQKSTDGTPIATRLISGGKFHDYQLEALHFKGELCFRMGIVENEASGPARKPTHIPIGVLPWLRERMAEMLVEHDGSQQLGPMPPTPEWILQEAKKQKEDAMLINAQPQEKIKGEKRKATLLAADDSEITLITGQTQKLRVKFLCSKTGDKYFIIRRFPSIPLPAAYLMLNGMDALLKDVAEKLNENSTNDDETAPKRRKKAVKRRGKLPLALQMVECGDTLGDYKLEAIWRKQRLYFQMWADKVEYKNRIFMPIWALPLLRERIAEMMAKHDGSQQIEPMPHVPDYVLEKD